MTASRALVTGVSSGIGAAIARRLTEAGWAVIGLSRRCPDGVAPSDATPEPGRLTWIGCDLAEQDSIDRSLQHMLTVDARPWDAVVHAAGLQLTSPLGAMEAQPGHRMWAVHVQAAIRLVNGLVNRIPEGGRIVLIGSRTAAGAAGKSQYSASKSALYGLGRSWAMELVDRRICVNVLAPGPTETEMTYDPARGSVPVKIPPFGRLISADEVAQYAEFLLGPAGAMITGQHLVMCAGTSV